MEVRTTSWIAGAVDGRLVGPDVAVDGPVVTDSREAGPGGLYVARRGENSDGHDYAPAALEAGAVALLVERELDLPCSQVVVEDATVALGALAHAHLEDLRARTPELRVLGITGSAGKTTTKDLLAQILSASAPTVAPRLSFNNEVGLPLTVLRADASTRYLVLEMGASGPGHLTHLTSIAAPDVAVVLMVGSAHLGGFGSVEGTAAAKAELVRGARPGAAVVLNADDARVSAMRPLATGPVLTFSASGDAGADVRALDVRTDGSEHASFTLAHGGAEVPVRLRLVGLHHVNNALAAATACLALGLDLAEVGARLERAGALSPHRMALSDLVIGGKRVRLVDDAYNANLDSMGAALDALEALAPEGDRLAVLGEMLELGEGSADIHRRVGTLARAHGVRAVIALGGEAGAYLEGEQGRLPGAHVRSVPEALDAVRPLLTDGCTLLVKGSNGSHAWAVADALREEGECR